MALHNRTPRSTHRLFSTTTTVAGELSSSSYFSRMMMTLIVVALLEKLFQIVIIEVWQNGDRGGRGGERSS